MIKRDQYGSKSRSMEVILKNNKMKETMITENAKGKLNDV